MAHLITLHNPWSSQGKAKTHLLIQLEVPKFNPQAYNMQPYQWSLLTILDLFHHMYQMRVRQELQLLCQLLSHPRSLVQYLHWYQAQYNLIIQVKIPIINPQYCHMQPHQWSLLAILSLLHHMYQAKICQELQVMFRVFSHPIILVQYLHWHQAQSNLKKSKSRSHQ